MRPLELDEGGAFARAKPRDAVRSIDRPRKKTRVESQSRFARLHNSASLSLARARFLRESQVSCRTSGATGARCRVLDRFRLPVDRSIDRSIDRRCLSFVAVARRRIKRIRIAGIRRRTEKLVEKRRRDFLSKDFGRRCLSHLYFARRLVKERRISGC